MKKRKLTFALALTLAAATLTGCKGYDEAVVPADQISFQAFVSEIEGYIPSNAINYALVEEMQSISSNAVLEGYDGYFEKMEAFYAANPQIDKALRIGNRLDADRPKVRFVEKNAMIGGRMITALYCSEQNAVYVSAIALNNGYFPIVHELTHFSTARKEGGRYYNIFSSQNEGLTQLLATMIEGKKLNYEYVVSTWFVNEIVEECGWNAAYYFKDDTVYSNELAKKVAELTGDDKITERVSYVLEELDCDEVLNSLPDQEIGERNLNRYLLNDHYEEYKLLMTYKKAIKEAIKQLS